MRRSRSAPAASRSLPPKRTSPDSTRAPVSSRPRSASAKVDSPHRVSPTSASVSPPISNETSRTGRTRPSAARYETVRWRTSTSAGVTAEGGSARRSSGRSAGQQQRSARHFLRNRQVEQLEQGRRDVFERAARAQAASIGVVDQQKRDRIGSMGGVRFVPLLVEHQLGVA